MGNNLFVRFGIFLVSAALITPVVYGVEKSSFVTVQTNKTNPLFGYMVGPDSEPLDRPVLKTFSSDGCSQSPNSYRGAEFVECCVQHDIAYWIGGTLAQKVASDVALGQCIANKTESFVGDAYQMGVKIGGAAKFRNSFRWGYGWDTLRPYGPLSESEIAQGERLYGKDLIELRSQVAQRQFAVNMELITYDISTQNRWHDDIIVYNFLKNTLKRSDVVTFAMKIDYLDSNFPYVIKLQSCGDNEIRIRLNRLEMSKQVTTLQKSILQRPWHQLKKFIVSVDDPGRCLE